MPESFFRYRGVRPVLDTTDQAEWDVAGYQISEAMMQRIARRLTSVMFSNEDRVVGPVRVRELEGFDVMFTVHRDGPEVVITIGGLRPPDAKNPTEEILKKLDVVATFRGALGI
ncbi:hypothetical protein [Salipiger abyssi]|uniref:hypothetical protein n=1 Tax=Salipiger abyssi TaxID=1250539 RepID=UPI004059909D